MASIFRKPGSKEESGSALKRTVLRSPRSADNTRTPPITRFPAVSGSISNRLRTSLEAGSVGGLRPRIPRQRPLRHLMPKHRIR